MVKLINVLCAMSIMLILVNCKTKKQATTPAETVTEAETMNKNLKKALIIDQEYVWPGSTDQFNTLSAEITNEDSLVIEVEYGGGCKEHVFKLITNGMLKKSMPPQCTLYLEHESNEDMCRALLRQKLSFYLGHLAKNGETIVVQLNGFDAMGTKLVLNPEKK
jgi:hypothetical protein